MVAVIVTDDADRATLAEALRKLSHRAQREMPAVERFTTDPPTPWSCRHEAINALLDSLDLLNLEP